MATANPDGAHPCYAPVRAPDATITPFRFPAMELDDVDLVTTSPEVTVAHLLAPGRRRAFFVNGRSMERSARNPVYRDALRRADMLLPNGPAPAGRATGDDRPNGRLNGTDLMPLLLAWAARRRRSIFLLGGAPGTAEAAALAMMLQTPGLRITGTCTTAAGIADPLAAIARINERAPDILLVSMDTPAQEAWLDRHGHLIDANLQMAVGSVFETFVSYILRSPRLLSGWRL